jgi:hypothetical protein
MVFLLGGPAVERCCGPDRTVAGPLVEGVEGL